MAMRKRKLTHIGKVSPRLSKSKHVLIPKSVSTTPKGSFEWHGTYRGHRYEIELHDNVKFLHVSKDQFYGKFSKNKDTDTPIDIGKRIYKYARAHKYDVIVLDVKIYGLNEYAIISMKAIKSVTKVS